MTVSVSIIIPFFNAKNFLSSLLESLLHQCGTNHELIFIDDGSTDGSFDQLLALTLRDPRVKIIKKTNGGVSSARNVGLDLAMGEWVFFVDADDTVESDFISSMYSAGQNHDLVICGYDSVGPDLTIPYVLPLNAVPITLDQVYEHSLCTPVINGGCCNKAFRLDLIRRHGLKFDERVSVGEDMVFLAQYYQQCRSAIYIERVLYHYTVNDQSLTQSAVTLKRVTERDASVLLAMDLLQEALILQTRTIKGYGRFRQVRSSLRLLFQMVSAGSHAPTGLKPVTRLVRGGLRHFLFSYHARWIERFTALCFALLPEFVFTMAVLMTRGKARWVSVLRS